MPVTYDDIIKGGVPTGREEREVLLQGIVHLEKISLPVSALLLADALSEDFPGDTAGWMRWALDLTGLDKCEIYHRTQIGTMLRALRSEAVVYRRLVKLSGDKLLAICRIKPEDVPAFLSTCRPELLDRSQLRKEVRKFLGLAMDDDDQTPTLPGFEAALDCLDQIESDDLIAEIRTPDRGRKYLNAGSNLLGAYVEYQRKQEVMDIPTLLTLKQGLLDQVAEIEALIAGNFDDGIDESISDGRGIDAAGEGEKAIATGLHSGAECGNHTDAERAGEPAGAADGVPDGGDGTAAVSGSGGADEAGTRRPVRSGRGPGGGDPASGAIPPAAVKRPPRKRSAHLQQLPELEPSAAPDGAGEEPDAGRSAPGARASV